MKRKGALLVSGILLILACGGPDANEPFLFPVTLMGEVPQPEHNLATVKGVALGRRLFFDPLLSSDNRLSCGSCHHPEKAFSDGLALSTKGVTSKKLLRHSPALFNLAWYPGFFWEGGASTLESQVFGPITHPDEMGMEIQAVVDKLRAHREYPGLFKEVWGTDSITSMLLARTLAQYERTLLSFGSFFDEVGVNGLGEKEKKGYALYQTHCASCHSGPLFTDLGYHNNGIDSQFADRSHELIFTGRYRITLDSADMGKYKTPSLRNLAVTAPYMHDGRFATLDAVLDHYARDHRGNELTDPAIRNLHFNEVGAEEKDALKAFLYTLNDSAFVGRIHARTGSR